MAHLPIPQPEVVKAKHPAATVLYPGRSPFGKVYFPTMLDKSFDCALCCEVAAQPYCCGNDSCTVLFCKKCSVKILQGGKTKCPYCQVPVKPGGLAIQRFVQSFINKQSVYCVHCKFATVTVGNGETAVTKKQKKSKPDEPMYLIADGCQFLGRYDALEGHLNNDCEWVSISCPLAGCDAQVPRRQLDSHREGCQHRIVACPHCTQTHTFKSASKHKSVCPMAEISCQKCQQRILRKEVESHIETSCPEALVTCPFAAQGCKRATRLCRKDYAQHQTSCAAYHAELSAMRMYDMEKSIVSLRTALEKSSNQVISLQSTLTLLRADIDTVQQGIRESQPLRGILLGPSNSCVQ